MKNKTTLFTTAYLPPIEYLSHFITSDKPVVEQNDNYIRQTYRNRCDILAANGVISLTVPVVKGRRLKVKTKDLEIAYDERWQALHWRSIVSAYNSSPFFEYYMDEFKPFYEKEFKFLFDYNTRLLEVILDALDLSLSIEATNEYAKASEEILDLREVIHPKKDYKVLDPGFTAVPYRQVFGDRFEFKPNLSVIDLVFNKGPEAIDYLEDSVSVIGQ